MRRQNGGASAARNTGRLEARSSWLLFLDADDRVADTFVERMQTAIIAHPTADLVRCNWAYETEDGRTEIVFNRELDADRDLFDVAAERSPFAIHSCVVRASLVDAVGGFDEHLRVGEDWDLWQRLARVGAKLVSVPEVLAFYLLRADSTMRRDARGALFDTLSVFRRGHSQDDRVASPIDRHRGGARVDPSRDVVAERVAWAVGTGVAVGADVPAHLPQRHRLTDAWLDPVIVAGTLYEAVPFGFCALPTDWPLLWATTSAALEAAVARFAEWSGHIGILEPTMRHLEKMVLLDSGDDQPRRVGASLSLRVDLIEAFPAIEPEDDVERVVVTVAADGCHVGVIDVPRLRSEVDRRQVVSVSRRELSARLARISLTRLSLARRLAPVMIHPEVGQYIARFACDLPWRDRSAVRDVGGRFAHELGALVGRRSSLLHSGVAQAQLDERSAARSAGERDPGTQYFEEIFSIEDPWAYTSPYEQTKYEQTLSLLDGLRPVCALELACARKVTSPNSSRHGWGSSSPPTSRRPPSSAPLTVARSSTTSSSASLISARAHCPPASTSSCVARCSISSTTNPSSGGWPSDLSPRSAPGGHVVTAHAKILNDCPGETGFPWDRPFGAKRIGQILATTDGLQLRREIVSPLYRIQLLQRVDDPHRSKPPLIEHRDHGDIVDPRLRRSVAWGGVAIMRSEAIATEVSNRLPVLMYHRVAPSGVAALDRYRIDPATFEAQLNHLRRNGYYGVTTERLRHAISEHRALPGRAVMLTFDDGYHDFLDYAHPLLDAYDFPATVFVVPQLVGSSATWDAHLGEPAPLLSWSELEWLSARAVDIGSHSGAHVALSGLAPAEAVIQEVNARRKLHEHVGRPVLSLSYPFGVHDIAIRATMVAAGYELAFTSDSGLATVWDDPMALPRLEVRGDEDMSAFTSKLPAPTRRNALKLAITRSRELRRSVTRQR